ncbi:MAG: phosphoglucosamine mutase, partial [Gammaproteobacteria bacterium]|nr:phosphoglucosamine mutase [Gammaproteobacteria bacterium]
STKPSLLRDAVLKEGADLGIALDGDGDRVIMVDHKGEYVDGDELVYIIASDRLRVNRLQGAVIGTLMSNLGLELALRSKGVDFHRAKVGDRYVMEMLKSTCSSLGGEGSGHIICLDRTTTGDGTVAALQVLAAMQSTSSSLHDLKAGMEKYPQRLVNVTLSKRIDLDQNAVINAAIKDVESQLSDQGRVLLRCSGTEPLVRVMVEGADEKLVSTLAEGLASVVSDAVAEA